MVVEVKRHPDHPEGDAERIAKRLRNSGEGSNPNVHTQHGTGAQLVHHNLHQRGQGAAPGSPARPTTGRVAKPSDYDGDDAA